MNSCERVIAFIGHGLQIARDAAMGMGIDFGSKASGHFLLHLSHSQITLSSVIGKCDDRITGKQKHRCFVFLQPFPQIMRIGFGYFAALTGRFRRNRGQTL